MKKKRDRKINTIVKEELANKIIPDKKTKEEILKKIGDDNKKLKKLIKPINSLLRIKRNGKRKEVSKEKPNEENER